jgi:hypothetical protein
VLDKLIGDPNAATELSTDQKKVFDLISDNGSGTLWIRDKAKRLGVARPLTIIKELTNLGLIESGRDNRNAPILTRIR